MENDKNRARLREARNLLLDKQIDATEYQEMKAEFEPIIDKLTSQQTASLKPVDADYKQYVKFRFSLFRNIDQYYESADIEAKHRLIGSIFPGKMTFEIVDFEPHKVILRSILLCRKTMI